MRLWREPPEGRCYATRTMHQTGIRYSDTLASVASGILKPREKSQKCRRMILNNATGIAMYDSGPKGVGSMTLNQDAPAPCHCQV
jgi:hypothetical protein